MKEILINKSLLIGLVSRDIKSRYLGSVAGFVWVLIHPIVLLSIYAFVFSHIFKIRSVLSVDINYVVFVSLALWPWIAFQESLQRGVGVVVSNANLVKKVVFPYQLLIYSGVFSSYLVNYVGYVVVLIIISIFYTPLVFSALGWFLFFTILQFIFTVSIVLFISALNSLFHDVEQIMGPLLMILFYLSPILYPLSLIPEGAKYLMYLNPFSFFVEGIRNSLLGIGTVDGLSVFSWTIFVLVFFLLCRLFFIRVSKHFEDFL